MGWTGAQTQKLRSLEVRKRGVHIRKRGNVEQTVTFKSLMSSSPRSSLSSLVMQYRIFSTWREGKTPFSSHHPKARGNKAVIRELGTKGRDSFIS